MQNLLQGIIVHNIFAFLLIFLRFGVALMIMPGIGDTFVSPKIRLLFGVAVSLVLTPVLLAHLPAIPANNVALLMLMISELVTGIFIGTVMRILISALDTAGTIVSVQAGLSAATMFNAQTHAETPIMSAVYSSLGVTLIFATNMDHQMLSAVVDSYKLFPVGTFPDAGSMSEVITRVTSLAFRVGVQITLPFIVVGMLLQLGLGVLSRLMPQLQIFFIALPVQIFLSLLLLMMTMSAGVLYWLDSYGNVLSNSLIPQ